MNDAKLSEKEKQIKIYPNPATDFVVVDYGFTNWNKGEISLEITNELRQLVYKQMLPMYSGFQKIEISQFASGAYQVNTKRSLTKVGSTKFSKQ